MKVICASQLYMIIKLPCDATTSNFLRSIQDICESADKEKNNYWNLIELRGFIQSNKADYPNDQFEFMKEHIDNHLEILAAKQKLNQIDQ